MRIALYNPIAPDMNTTPSLGLLYIAAKLEKAGHTSFVFDERFNKNAVAEVINFQPQVLGITSVTASFKNGLSAAEKIKNKLKDIRIVFGGPHASALPEPVVSEPLVDYVMTGECENSFPQLCEAINCKNETESDLENIKNLTFKTKTGDKITSSVRREEFLNSEELDLLPFPAFHLMNIDAYFNSPQEHGLFQKGKRILPIMTTRGCPFTCDYCCRIMGKTLRKRSVGNILSEIKTLIGKYDIDELYIEDDNFTADKKRAIEVLDAIIPTGLKHIKFANGLNVQMIDEEILIKMKEAGAYSLSFGVESGCAETLKKMNKKINLDYAEHIIMTAKKMGFLVGSNCIIGYPGETKKDIRTSIDFFMKLKLDSMAIVNIVPFPGTETRRICEEKQYLTEEAADWNNYYFSINNPIPLIKTEYLSKSELKSEINRAYWKMYFNPVWFFRNLKHLSLKKIIAGARQLIFKRFF
ncbi:MAG TPA: radical SAM protein [bacterium]|nr:radical SAM protein [bacterium]HPN29983.1 radical SAM protein [bacterium]